MEANTDPNKTIIKHKLSEHCRFEDPVTIELPGLQLLQFPQETFSLKFCIPKGCNHCGERVKNPTREVGLCTCDQRLCRVFIKFDNNLDIMSNEYQYQLSCRVLRKGKKATFLFSHSFRRKDSLVTRESFLCDLRNTFKYEISEIYFELSRKRRNSAMANRHQSLSEFYCQLYHLGQCSQNIAINVAGRTFNVNQQILSLKSPVFHAMFSHGMREDQDKVVNIDGFDADTVDLMLQYMYTNDTKNIHKRPFDLFKIADRYGVLDLMDNCVEWMKFNVNSETSMPILRLAILYELNDLKKGVCQYIEENVNDFVQRCDYRDYLLEELNSSTVLKTLNLCEEYPSALKEVKTKIMEYLRQNITKFMKMDEFLKLFEGRHGLIKEVFVFAENHKKRKISDAS